jgi:type IV pilus assembly protein PilB
MHIDEEKLKKVILESGAVSRSDLDKAISKAEENKKSFSEILLSDGKISETDLRQSEAFVLGISFVSLVNKKIDFLVLSLIPETIARNYNIISYKKVGEVLEVAMLHVDDLPIIDFVKKRSGLKILPRLTDTASIKSSLLQYRKSLQAELSGIIQKEVSSLNITKVGDIEKSAQELKMMAEDLPVVKVFDSLISHAILQNASDIHIEPREEELMVRYRIDGLLHDVMILNKNVASSITARIKVLSNLKLDEKRLPQDGRFKIEQDGEKTSFRVSTIPTFFGEKTVIRILKENAQELSLEKLGFQGEALEQVYNSLKQRSGLILAAGPTGSGKTTTLYTMLEIVNKPEVNISTIEDPIEYQLEQINQTQVKPEIGLTFANGLRSLLRQDPDIIMVGEIRDRETAGLAINASLTGHLVLSTIHTNSAAGSLPRLIDMGVEAFLIISTVKCIISQRLVRKLTASKEKYFLSSFEIKKIANYINLDDMLNLLKKTGAVGPKSTWEKIPFYKAVKSNDSEDGYLDRISINEVLKVTSTIKEMIIHGDSSDKIEIQAKKEGMTTILEDGISKAVLGVTTLEEVFRVISD